jgi:molybdopterin converting factor subunit 1
LEWFVLPCAASGQALEDPEGGIGESIEDVIGVGRLHRQTITKWLWFVKRAAAQFRMAAYRFAGRGSQRCSVAYAVWMRVTVLYFGVLKDVMGHRSAVMDVAEGASVGELVALHRLSEKAAASVWDSIAVAVNQEYARAEDVLKDGDEVALLPPVSGGIEGKERYAG